MRPWIQRSTIDALPFHRTKLLRIGHLMPDRVDAQTRSRIMSSIGSKNTVPELMIRKGLHARGFRYRLHSSNVPGKPDLMLPRYNALIFVHGCFWHGHDCHLSGIPKTRTEFWTSKLERNRRRDTEVRNALLKAGWRILVIWGCSLKGRQRLDLEDVLDQAAAWIRGKEQEYEIEGTR